MILSRPDKFGRESEGNYREAISKAKKKRNLSKKEKEKEYLEREDIQEALNVALDMLDVNAPLSVLGQTHASPKEAKN